MQPILPNVTRNYILSLVTQEDIFAHYSGLSSSDIQNCIQNHSDLIRSPIRVDNEPTVGFKYASNGRLRMRDFNGSFWGDCFDIVAYRLGVDASTSIGFAKVLDHVCKEFKIHKYAKNFNIVTNYQPELEIKLIEKAVTIIDINFRNWLSLDAKVWLHLNRNDLDEAKIAPCLHIWVNKQLIYKFDVSDPAYAYCFGNGLYKVYFPFRKKFRFISNTSMVQGIQLIEPSYFGLITKSYKDVIYLRKFGINAVSPSAESVLLTPMQIMHIKIMWQWTLSFMDYDNAGIHMAWQMRKIYGIEPIFLKNKTWARKQGLRGAKDFSDYVQMFGLIATKQLINETIDYFNENYNLNAKFNNT